MLENINLDYIVPQQQPSLNKNARIESRLDRTGKVRTETVRRDPRTVKMAVSTDLNRDRTIVYLDAPLTGEQISLDGRSARTLYTLLQRHYDLLGKRA